MREGGVEAKERWAGCTACEWVVRHQGRRKRGGGWELGAGGDRAKAAETACLPRPSFVAWAAEAGPLTSKTRSASSPPPRPLTAEEASEKAEAASSSARLLRPLLSAAPEASPPPPPRDPLASRADAEEEEEEEEGYEEVAEA